jgi:hypothetical protein
MKLSKKAQALTNPTLRRLLMLILVILAILILSAIIKNILNSIIPK